MKRGGEMFNPGTAVIRSNLYAVIRGLAAIMGALW